MTAWQAFSIPANFSLLNLPTSAFALAAASLAEGLEETLTVIDLKLAPRLRRTLSNTNAIESGFAMVEKICRQVKRWQGRDHRIRWVASALMFAENRWNRLTGYRHLPALMNSLDAAYQTRTGSRKATAVA